MEFKDIYLSYPVLYKKTKIQLSMYIIIKIKKDLKKEIMY